MFSNKLKVLLSLTFVTGFGIGTFCGYIKTKQKYESMMDAEIASVKEAYKAKYQDKNEEKKEVSNETDTIVEKKESPEVAEYANLIRENGYNKNAKSEDVEIKPYVITQDEYMEEMAYKKASLTLYEDGIVADGVDEIITIPESLIGDEYEEYIGKEEEDTVYVRNENLKIDYEIVRDYRTYDEVVNG